MSTKLFPSVQVGAAKTANRFVKLRGSTHVSALCRLLLSFTCMQAFEDKECLHVGVCVRSANACWALQAAWFQRFLRRFFPAVLPHEGYCAGFFVSDVLPPSALGLCGAPFGKAACF